MYQRALSRTIDLADLPRQSIESAIARIVPRQGGREGRSDEKSRNCDFQVGCFQRQPRRLFHRALPPEIPGDSTLRLYFMFGKPREAGRRRRNRHKRVESGKRAYQEFSRGALVCSNIIWLPGYRRHFDYIYFQRIWLRTFDSEWIAVSHIVKWYTDGSLSARFTFHLVYNSSHLPYLLKCNNVVTDLLSYTIVVLSSMRFVPHSVESMRKKAYRFCKMANSERNNADLWKIKAILFLSERTLLAKQFYCFI